VSNDKTLKVGDKVAYYKREAEVVIPDLGVTYWTRGARIRYTTGDAKGDLADVPIADLRPLAEHETAAGKARAAAERAAAEHSAKIAGIHEELVAKATAAVERIAATGIINLHTMTDAERRAVENAAMISTCIHSTKIIDEAIDRVKEKTKQAKP
jgi:hypothetical protein